MRPRTDYIVLHTTEGGESGSLSKIQERGEAHYFVSLSGQVCRIIDKDKIATHAGRSMWNGRTVLDNYSIGIEIVGYHNQDLNKEQYPAIRELLRQLKSLYHIRDENVLTHSMVAYGRPNKFHGEMHRGRKRCGMILASPEVREALGLRSRPARDADVEAGRLMVADARLYRFLFAPPALTEAALDSEDSDPAFSTSAEASVISRGWTAWHIAREEYDRPTTTYIFPNGERVDGDKVQNWGKIPVGTRVLLHNQMEEQRFEGFMEVGTDDTARSIAGEEFDKRSTIYFFPNGLIRTGWELKGNRRTRRLLENLPKGTRVLTGYIYGGYVRTHRPPSSIAGIKWNYPSTFYRFPDGTIVNGDEIDDSAIPPRTLIFYQN